MSRTHTRRLMRTGVIRSHTVTWGTRLVWVAYEADVARYVEAATADSTVHELASELGWSYPQLWHVIADLDLRDPRHRPGAPIRLSVDALEKVRAEAERRTAIIAAAVTIQEAAQVLDLHVDTVGTLVRQGHLTATEGPSQSRTRYLTRESVVAYLRAYPVSQLPEGCENPLLLNFTATRQLLGVTRPELSTLVTTRQVRTASKERNRHVYVTADSALDWAERTGRSEAATAIRKLMAAHHGL